MIVKSAETCQPGESILSRGISLKHEPSLFISEWFELTPPEVHGFFVSKSEVLNARNSSDVAGCFVLHSDLWRVLVGAVVLLWLLHCLEGAGRRDVCLRFCGFVVGNELKEERRRIVQALRRHLFV